MLDWTIRTLRILQEGTIWSEFSCSTGLLQSAAMKFSIIAALVVFALAHGSLAQDTTELEKLDQYFETMKNKMTQELSKMAELFNTEDLTSQAQTFLENQRTQLESISSHLQDQLKAISTTAEQQLKPMADNIQAQIQPMLENIQKQMEVLQQQLAEKTKPIAN
ncbi:hypothetical protein LDENG_00226880 [Lucifuga dentata]|nr:hypothetical protein LDENG_00226880 [Lucifuga dentata]